MKFKLAILFCSLSIASMFSQKNIISEDFLPYTTYFSLTNEHKIEEKAKKVFIDAIGDNQFVGIAEVHNSKQLSYFTKGFIELLKEKEFNHFALEIGPYSANTLQEITKNPNTTAASIKTLNKTYGKSSKTPIVFVDKIEDAPFVEMASELNFKFWGLDQENQYSYEMHIDTIYSWVNNGNKELSEEYKKSKELIRKNLFKKKVNGKTTNCWIKDEPTINRFFKMSENNAKAKGLIDALKISSEFYCINESNQSNNQLRADYMKTNFNRLYDKAQNNGETLPKVFVKLGGIHLTHSISAFGVHDMGEFLTIKGKENHTGFLAIRHLSKYRNGRSLVGKPGWKGYEILMELGKKDSWTIVDLRPIRKKLENKELRAEKKIRFEVYSYDLLLIPPNDSGQTVNN